MKVTQVVNLENIDQNNKNNKLVSKLAILILMLSVFNINPLYATEPNPTELIDKTSGDENELESYGKSDLGSSMTREINLRSSQAAWDVSLDTANVARFEYSPDKTYKIRLRQYMSSLIKLPDDEKILFASLGDQSSFTVTLIPIKGKITNMASIRGLYAGADTNLTILGKSNRIYNFYLRTDRVNSEFTPDLTVYIDTPLPKAILNPQFDKSNIEGANLANSYKHGDKDEYKYNSGIKDVIELSKSLSDRKENTNDYLNSLPMTSEINTNYIIKGDKKSASIAPYGIYDDGHLTYFDYRGVVGDELPLLYKVIDGYDTVVNYRVEEGFLVAEGLGFEGWSIINGDKVICVRASSDIAEYWNNKRNESGREYDIHLKKRVSHE